MKLYKKYVTISDMMEKEKTYWLTRRLKELGKTKTDFAKCLDVNNARIYELENGRWKLQVNHIKKAADFLEFDRVAFLDFISGDITEEELWSYKKPEEISSEDLALLRAVKLAVARPQTTETAQNTAQPPATPQPSKGRGR